MIFSILYVLATLGANYTADWFIPILFFGQVSTGTFIFALTFFARDKIHHKGRFWVYSVLGIAALCNVIMSGLVGIPIRIIWASLTAILISESVDTEIFQSLKSRSWLVRALSSNAISVPLDTVIFTAIAFGGVLSHQFLISLLFGETLVKWLLAAIISLIVAKRQKQIV